MSNQWAGFLAAAVGVIVGAVQPAVRAAAISGESVSTFDPFTWPNDIPDSCPLQKSLLFDGVTFTGRYADYGAADTWFPCWLPSGDLRSPFTDGKVGEIGAGTPNPGAARIAGDDPLKLEVAPLTTVNSNLGGGTKGCGRYPSASLVSRSVWYYGTYLLTNHDNSVAMPHSDWQVLEPFAGFRYSIDDGKRWTDTTDPDHGLFEDYHHSDAINADHEIMIGAPHFVDFGKNMQFAPTDPKTSRKYAYMTAHGADASATAARNSWVMGDNVYLLRILLPAGADAKHGAAYLNTAQNWQYYTKSSGWLPWDKNHLDAVRLAIQPIVHWEDPAPASSDQPTFGLGETTVTYDAPLKTFLMCIARCITANRFDTMILEAPRITGPYRIAHYLTGFGPVAYFPAIPSKFISGDGRTMWLSYSANYGGQKANVAGAAYALCLREFTLNAPGEAERKYQAESGTLAGGAAIYGDPAASNGNIVAYLNSPGRSVSFPHCPAASRIGVTYASIAAGAFSLYINGKKIQEIQFPATGQWTGPGAYRKVWTAVPVPEGAKVTLQCDEGDTGLNLDAIELPQN
ncbi:hypothetical protein CCAX7_55810 [Capsulimonas corticalis]|uniref:Uncharacterized protein n=1 Tax=Capsulimonas corticalis TaxID=2219043 RepID=A0A402D0V9_9BACT|nr:hypothetical protein [Capsulimonas corticalis]BDI33530.1 hypothetical protein CCAX7_55810 [Capsulimonas corticalis]